MEKTYKTYGIVTVVFLIITVLLQWLARTQEGFATWYAHRVYPALVGAIGRIMGIFPFSVVEITIYVLIFICFVYVLRFFKKPVRILSRGFCLIAILLFLYTINCGVNYYAAPFSSFAGLQTGYSTKEQLLELCTYLVEQVNENATQEGYQENQSKWRENGVAAMKKAGERFPSLAGFYPKPKEVTVSYLLSVQQLCGIYSPFTIEANFNGAMPSYNIPHTICHELSHLKGFMREDEANFIGYLACIQSESQAFRYSGYLTGWVYAGNALAGVDMETYIELQSQLRPEVIADLRFNSDFWNQYEGKVAEAANQINDTYLKMNDQEDGVKSYGRMVDLMLAYYTDSFENN